jgi:hypothetical protein
MDLHRDRDAQEGATQDEAQPRIAVLAIRLQPGASFQENCVNSSAVNR